MSNYVVVARFDDEMTEKLIALRNKLHNENHLKVISEWQPHITIAAYENVDIQALLQWTEAFAKAHSAFDISLSTLGAFPPYGEHTETIFVSQTFGKAKITALEVYTYPMELIHRFELNN